MDECSGQEISNGQGQTDTSEVGQNHICRLQESKEGFQPLIQRLFPFAQTATPIMETKLFEEVTSMNKEKWTDNPVTWGGLIKICGILTAISSVLSAAYCIILIKPSWWTGFRKTVSRLFNGWIRRKGRF